MGVLICFFRGKCEPGRKRWLCDLMVKAGFNSRSDPLGQHPVQRGLYQCTRCHRISLGEAQT